jgi:hypothetical protein
MAKKPESRRQRRIRRALEKEVGGWWKKIHGGPFQAAGIPDLIGCVGGYFFAIEVKEPNEPEASEVQRAQAERIREDGHGAVKLGCETPEEAVDFVTRLLQTKHFLADMRDRKAAEEAAASKRADERSGPAPKRRRRVRRKTT